MPVSRHDLARQYDRQRAEVARIFGTHGHGPAHTAALAILACIANNLHRAERVADVPRGSTRRGMAA